MSRRPEVLPTVEAGEDRVLGVKSTHPAFGVISAHRRQGGSTRLFGSDLVHHHTVSIEIRGATQYRGLSSDFRMGTGPVIAEFEMSEAQWAQFISSLNMGAGTAITFNYRQEGDLIECPRIAEPRASKAQLHSEEMKEELTKRIGLVKRGIERLMQMCNEPGSIPKKELQEIVRGMDIHFTNLPSNISFIYDQFREATETTVEQAKSEIEGFVGALALRTGIEELRKLAPTMPHQEITDES